MNQNFDYECLQVFKGTKEHFQSVQSVMYCDQALDPDPLVGAICSESQPTL